MRTAQLLTAEKAQGGFFYERDGVDTASAPCPPNAPLDGGLSLAVATSEGGRAVGHRALRHATARSR